MDTIVTGIEIGIGIGIGLLVVGFVLRHFVAAAIVVGVLAAFSVAVIAYGYTGLFFCLVVGLAAFFAETYRRKQELVRFNAGTARRRAELEAQHIEENKRLTVRGADASNFARWKRQEAEVRGLADSEWNESIRLQRRLGWE